MNNVFKLQRGSMGNKPCVICDEKHIPETGCRKDAMASKILRLTEVNKMLPAVMATNKEYVMIAKQFQVLLKQADAAHGILLEILAEHGDTGKVIEHEYLTRINKWVSTTISPDTTEPQSNTENSTSSETEDKVSTAETLPGESSPSLS